MCCNLFHVLAIHLCEYVLTTLPRKISKVLNVCLCCTCIWKNTEVYVDFCKKKLSRKYFDDISLIHNTKSW